MPFKRFVEVGRLCLVTYGPMEGKLCVVVNIIDQSHVLVDGTPAGDAGTPRMGMSLKRMMLTDLKVPIKLNATAKCVAAFCTPCCLDPALRLCRGMDDAWRTARAELDPLLETRTRRRIGRCAPAIALPFWSRCGVVRGVPPGAPAGQRHVRSEILLPASVLSLVPPPAPAHRKLKEAWDAEGTMAAWEESSWAQKRKRHITRKGLSDFARFEAMLARKERSAARAKKM